jgi:hypothetical protein
MIVKYILINSIQDHYGKPLLLWMTEVALGYCLKRRSLFYGLIFILLAIGCDPFLEVKEIKKENGRTVFILKKPTRTHAFSFIEMDSVSRKHIKTVWDVRCIEWGRKSCPLFDRITYGVVPEGYYQNFSAQTPDPLVPGKEYVIDSAAGEGTFGDSFKMPL